MMRRSLAPGCLRRLDELLLAQREEEAANDPRDRRPEEEGEDEADPQRIPGAEEDGSGQQDREPRQREHEVGEAHEQVVHVAAVVAGQRTDSGAERGREQGDEDRHPERRPDPEHDAAQVVASELVGAEEVPASSVGGSDSCSSRSSSS